MCWPQPCPAVGTPLLQTGTRVLCPLLRCPLQPLVTPPKPVEAAEVPALNISLYKTRGRFPGTETPSAKGTLGGSSWKSMRFSLQPSLAQGAAGKAPHCRHKHSLFTIYQGTHTFFFFFQPPYPKENYLYGMNRFFSRSFKGPIPINVLQTSFKNPCTIP